MIRVQSAGAEEYTDCIFDIKQFDGEATAL